MTKTPLSRKNRKTGCNIKLMSKEEVGVGGCFRDFDKKRCSTDHVKPPPKKKFIGSGDSSCEKHDVFHPQKHAID